MAKLELRLSSKVQQETGRQEILVRFFNGKEFNQRAKSGIYVSPEYFEYFVDRRRTRDVYGQEVPDRVITATIREAEKFGWVLRDSGEIVVNSRRIETPEMTYHREQSERVAQLKKQIMDVYKLNKKGVSGKWLEEVVDRFNHPKRYNKAERTFYELLEDYITKPHGKQVEPIAEKHARVYRVLARAAARYEGFVRKMGSNPEWSWDINHITSDDMEDFREYLKNEKCLSEEYPDIFKEMLENYPANVKKGKNVVEARGGNTVVKMMKRMKTLFKYFADKGYTTNNPFAGVTIGQERVGEPIYITIEERNIIAETDLAKVWEKMDKEERRKARMPIETLIAQRDIFVFQCLVGCRVGDLVRLTPKHIHDGFLVYTPHKTRNAGESQVPARVPLHPKALALIKKYKGVDAQGRLFPCISGQRFNDALKVIFRMAGVTRYVEVRNPLTGENEVVSIDTIASSHMARRTFCGNLYLKVQDPALIGKMSGHTEGSKAFARYRRIENVTLRSAIDLIG